MTLFGFQRLFAVAIGLLLGLALSVNAAFLAQIVAAVVGSVAGWYAFSHFLPKMVRNRLLGKEAKRLCWSALMVTLLVTAATFWLVAYAFDSVGA